MGQMGGFSGEVLLKSNEITRTQCGTRMETESGCQVRPRRSRYWPTHRQAEAETQARGRPEVGDDCQSSWLRTALSDETRAEARSSSPIEGGPGVVGFVQEKNGSSETLYHGTVKDDLEDDA